MSNNASNDSSSPEALADRVRAVQNQLQAEKVDEFLKDTANPKLPLGHRESLANQAMWLLKSAQGSTANGVDYNLPQPNFVRFQAVQPVALPGWALTRDAYSSNDTSTVFAQLELIQQVAEANMQGPPLGENGQTAQLDAPTKAVMVQIDGLKVDLRETHYALIAVGLHLHYYLDWLFDQWGAMKFIEAKTQIETLIMSYNAHVPDFAISIEESALRGFRVVTGITHDVMTYLASPAFYQAQQAKQTQQAALAAPVAAPLPPMLAPPVLYPTAIAAPAPAPAAAPAVPPATPPTAFPSAAPAAPAASAAVHVAKVRRVTKKKGGAVSVFAVTAANSVTIDLSPTRNPTDVISEIEQLFLTYIGEGLDTVTQMKAAAQSINYNIYTNQFGSVASTTDNVSMLEGIRGNILRYISDQFHPSPCLEPLIFVVQDMAIKFFPGAIGPGDPISTLNLLPGESVEKRLKTSETDSTKRAQTNSVVDSSSQTAKQNLKNSISNKQTSDHTATSDYNQYQSANQTSTQHDNTTTKGLAAAGSQLGQLGGQIGGAISSIPGVPAGGQSVGQAIGNIAGGVTNFLQNIGVIQGGPKTDITQDSTVTSGGTSGSDSTMNDTRHDASEAMSEAVAENTQETNANRQVSVTDSTEATTETTKEETETRTFKNPNRSSTMTIVFSQIIRRYTAVTLWESEHIMFSNGIVADGVPITGLNAILDRIIRSDHPEVKDMVRNFVKRSLNVVDWQGRLIDILDESAGYPRIRVQPYMDMLGAQGLLEEAGDALLRPYNADLEGVVTDVNSYTMVVPGVFADVNPGHVAFDANEEALLSAEIQHNVIANDRALLENQVIQEKLDFLKSITDDELKLRAFFEIFKDDKVVLDKTFLGNILRDKDGADGLLKRLKLTA